MFSPCQTSLGEQSIDGRVANTGKRPEWMNSDLGLSGAKCLAIIGKTTLHCAPDDKSYAITVRMCPTPLFRFDTRFRSTIAKCCSRSSTVYRLSRPHELSGSGDCRAKGFVESTTDAEHDSWASGSAFESSCGKELLCTKSQVARQRGNPGKPAKRFQACASFTRRALANMRDLVLRVSSHGHDELYQFAARMEFSTFPGAGNLSETPLIKPVGRVV